MLLTTAPVVHTFSMPTRTGREFCRFSRDLGVVLPQGHLKLQANIALPSEAERKRELDELKGWLDLFAEVGMAALREKNERLTGYLEYTVGLLAKEHPDAAISVITPRDSAQRGCQISIDIAGRERKLFDDMIAAGVIADFREPCIIRMAPVPLYNSFEDVFNFGKVMRELLADH